MPVPLTPQEIERWDRVLAAAAKLQSAIPEAFLVGGTVVGIYAPYRTSRDADHLMADRPCFNLVETGIRLLSTDRLLCVPPHPVPTNLMTLGTACPLLPVDSWPKSTKVQQCQFSTVGC